MKNCTLWRNFSQPLENKSLTSIAAEIASSKYQNVVEKIRRLMAENRLNEAAALKQQLPAFTPSATFRAKRQLLDMDEYSNIIHLDFDNIGTEKLDLVFKQASALFYTRLCFISPSGNGLKVFVEVNNDFDEHPAAYKEVQEYYEFELGIKADSKCKDITRLCFMSWHPGLHWNENSEIFEKYNHPLLTPAGDTHLSSAGGGVPTGTEVVNGVDDLMDCLHFTEQKKTYTGGSRNEFIYSFACNTNRAGIDKIAALRFCLGRFDLPFSEICASFNSAYTHHAGEFAKYNHPLPPPAGNNSMSSAGGGVPPFCGTEVVGVNEDHLKNTPHIPEGLYRALPDLLRAGAEPFKTARERDVFLTGALTILSGCLPGVKGIYDGVEVFPNLYSFTIAPAASGKGAMKFARMLADEYHGFTLTASREAEAKYKQDLAAYKMRLNSKKKHNGEEEPEPAQPAFKVVFLPANGSHAKILSHLQQNEGFGIMCETEADTMGNVFKQDWGGYSDMLRKAFHHESISSTRKANNEYTEVNNPRLSVALTGTPGQVTGLISSSEDGLFSRFLFYAFKVEQKWKDTSPSANRVNLTAHFRALSVKVFELVQFLQLEETHVELSEPQWQQLMTFCSGLLEEVTVFTAEEAASVVKRLGLIIYRIAMLFTALRKFENGEIGDIGAGLAPALDSGFARTVPSAQTDSRAEVNPAPTFELTCTDSDFAAALQLGECYLQHSIFMFNNLPKQTETTHFNGSDNKKRFFEALPKEFTRAEAVGLGEGFGLSPSFADKFLRTLNGNYLDSPRKGFYRKI